MKVRLSACICALLLLGACSHYSTANRPCESKSCQKYGTWNACYGDHCAIKSNPQQQ
ncbi:hypothetical protein [Neisseria perflava]|uniref:hypothetical protein n=1 Tax=Neisseria perflava TaxID=33053 RepID=UPI00209DD8AA|nr:hypothetical protein [Neisseria perflava]MCP1659703.1 hypothetical protein [Neisseria perflava]MCP1771277.1 hypothetical protein [Neisseria perflava]